MKYILHCIFLLFWYDAFCQFGPAKAVKPLIDTGAYFRWTFADNAGLSPNGKFAYCETSAGFGSLHTLVVKSTQDNWKVEVTRAYNCRFTPDSKVAIFSTGNDSIGIVRLGTDKISFIPGVLSFTVLNKSNGELLAFQLEDDGHNLVLADLLTGEDDTLRNITSTFVSNNGKALVVERRVNSDTLAAESLELVNFKTGRTISIWQGGEVNNLLFDSSQKRVAFFVGSPIDSVRGSSIWYYENGMSKATLLLNDSITQNTQKLKLQQFEHFSADGESLFVELMEASSIFRRDPIDVSVDVWNYQDRKLQSEQLQELEKGADKSYFAVIHIPSHQMIRLQGPADAISYERNDRFCVYYEDNSGFHGERKVNSGSYNNVYLVYTVDGERKLIKKNTNLVYRLSPLGKYLIYYDPKQKNFFSYSTATGIIRNITRSIHTDWTEYANDHTGALSSVGGVSGWIKDDSALLLHDQNDLWVVDLAGIKAPINLTNNFGKRKQIVFRLAMNEGGRNDISPHERVILSAFNRVSKMNGFFCKALNEEGDPTLLTMGPYIFNMPGNNPSVFGEDPQKASDSDAFIVKRMSASESPNYFFTVDFKRFSPISNVHPEANYNWLTSKLISWRALDGQTVQGILYKPEDFDPKKKYPVIFYYYERWSDRLNVYQRPESSGGALNIPSYVSNGYIVVAPDIHYKIGETGQSVLNSVVPAASYLVKFPWVDGKKMAIEGHSFGGYETNYLVTHSHLFAAACSASGLSDFVSGYGSLSGEGKSLAGMYEDGQFRLGTSLWKRPNLYIKNSPLFRADHVTTPLLMMHTKNDALCSFSNAVEFFLALSHLGKKVWMLQYDNHNHTLYGPAAVDFSIRMRQFFDHYLKGAPMPSWMKDGVPARMKGIDSGLEIGANSSN